MNGKQIYDMLFAEYKAQMAVNMKGQDCDIIPFDEAAKDDRTQAEILRDVKMNAELLGFRKAVQMVGHALKEEGAEA